MLSVHIAAQNPDHSMACYLNQIIFKDGSINHCINVLCHSLWGELFVLA